LPPHFKGMLKVVFFPDLQETTLLRAVDGAAFSRALRVVDSLLQNWANRLFLLSLKRLIEESRGSILLAPQPDPFFPLGISWPLGLLSLPLITETDFFFFFSYPRQTRRFLLNVPPQFSSLPLLHDFYLRTNFSFRIGPSAQQMTILLPGLSPHLSPLSMAKGAPSSLSGSPVPSFALRRPSSLQDHDGRLLRVRHNRPSPPFFGGRSSR